MTSPIACIRCRGNELVSATFEAGTGPRVLIDSQHASPVVCRVCLGCGAIMLTAADPGALRVAEREPRDVQEYDF